MPFSSNNGKYATDRIISRLVSHLKATKPSDDRIQVLDIGVGCGTYRDRYKDLMPNEACSWTGVEIWEPYVEKYNLQGKYETLILEDVRLWAKNNADNFQIAFVGDILEHMTKEEAVTLMGYLSIYCDLIVLAIPIVHYPQPAFEGNPYEEHIKDDWSHQEVVNTWHQLIREWSLEGEIGVYFMSTSRTLHAEIFKPRIGVYGICKNEEQTIKRTLASIKSADQIVICDTGSTDDTIGILSDHYHTLPESRHKCVHISVQPWRFDEARNTAMMMLDDDLDLAVSIDMDEYLQEGWYDILCGEVTKHIRERGRPFDIYHHRFSTEWDWQMLKEGERSKNFTSHWHTRIHTRHNWKWALPVHEVLDYTGEGTQQECYLGGLTMYQRPIQKEGRSTYLPLLEISVKERPNVWKSWSFYADELNRAGKRGDAMAALDKALSLPDCDKGYIFKFKSDIDPDNGMVWLLQAMQASPFLREYPYYAALWCEVRGKQDLAGVFIEQAAKLTTPSTGYQYNKACWGVEFDRLVKSYKGEAV